MYKRKKLTMIDVPAKMLQNEATCKFKPQQSTIIHSFFAVYLKHRIVVIELVSDAKKAAAVVQVVIKSVDVVSSSVACITLNFNFLSNGSSFRFFRHLLHATLKIKVPSVPIPEIQSPVTITTCLPRITRELTLRAYREQ